MMTSADQWDWKTSAPEFVPGGATPGIQCDIIPIPTNLHDNGPVQPGFGGPLSVCGPIGAISAPGLMCNNGLGPFVGGGLGQLHIEPASMMANGDNSSRPMLPGPGPGLNPPPFPGLPQPPQPPGRPIGPRGFEIMGPGMQPMTGLQGMPPPQNGMPGRPFMGFEDPNAVGQIRQHYEWQMQAKDHELRDLQRRLGREEVERMQMQQEFERDRDGLLQHVSKLAAAVERAGISVENKPGQSSKKVLQTKMEKLNNLLQKPSEDAIAPTQPGRGKGGHHKGYPGQRPPAPSGFKSAPAATWAPYKGGQTSNSSSSAAPGPGSRRLLGDRTGPSSTLRPFGGLGEALDDVEIPTGQGSSRLPDRGETDRMEESVDRPPGIAQANWSGSSAPSKESRTPAATSSRMPADRDELERAIRDLARCSSEKVDDEIREAVESLANGPGGIAAVRQAVRRVEELAQAEEGRCSNFVSVLQGVCRKIRRRFEQPIVPSSASRAPAPDSSGNSTERSSAWERHSMSDRRQGTNVSSAFRDPRAYPKALRDKRLTGGDRSQGKHHKPWSQSGFEKLSRQGSFDLRRGEDGNWELQISLSELEPPITDEGMQVFCKWLHERLRKVKEQIGQVPLKDVLTEVNFSRNGLGDEAIGRLLQALQRSELQITCLNLYANRIGADGARYITDFLWYSNSVVQELHLSHNELDDESAIEIMRVLAEKSGYPPKAASYGGKDIYFPVWVRMNNNWIQDPHKVLKTAENELGVAACLARDKRTCGLRKCGRRGSGGAACPLLHLYMFDTQDSPQDSQQAQRTSTEVSPSNVSSSTASTKISPRAVEERFLPGHCAPAPSDVSSVPAALRERNRKHGWNNPIASSMGVGTPSSIASSALNRRSDTTTESTAKPVNVPQIMVAPGRFSANDSIAEECDPDPDPTETGGVPEQTPEPDEVCGNTSRESSTEVNEVCEEAVDDTLVTLARRPLPPAPEEEPPLPPVRPLMTAPTRILRREVPQAAIASQPGDSTIAQSEAGDQS